MLKQQPTNTQQLPHIPLPAPQVRMGEATQAGTSAKVQHVPRITRRRMAPLYLSWWQMLAAFTLPVLYGLLLMGMQMLPNSFRFNDDWAVLQVVIILPLPVLLCVLLGYHLRTRRVAALTGAMGWFSVQRCGMGSNMACSALWWCL